jgi:hypothetical protein
MRPAFRSPAHRSCQLPTIFAICRSPSVEGLNITRCSIYYLLLLLPEVGLAIMGRSTEPGAWRAARKRFC